MATAAVWGFGQGLRQLAAGVGGIDLLVHHADFDGAVHAARDALVFCRQLLVQGLTFGLGRCGQFLLVQNADGGLGPITATSASGQANTLVAPSEREFIAM